MKFLNSILTRSNFRKFHASPNRNAIPPLFWLVVKPISKLGSIILGRSLRRLMNSPEALQRKQLVLNHFKTKRIYYIFGFVGLSGGGYANYLSHIEETPITKRKRFMIFNTSHLKEIEEMEKKKIIENYKNKILPIDHKLTSETHRVANRLFMANKQIPQVADINWKLTVIDANIVNAFAFPSGEVFVFTGLLNFVQNVDELAFIMAHEMSHAILQHGAEEMSHSRIIDLISIGMSLIIWSLFPSDSTAVFMESISAKFHQFLFSLPHSRSLEKEADCVGMQLAARACFDVRTSPLFWKRMNAIEKEEKIPEFLSTHPSNETRASDLEALMTQALQLRKDCNCYQLSDKLPNKSDNLYAKIMGFTLKKVSD